jgi:hypothetical protein
MNIDPDLEDRIEKLETRERVRQARRQMRPPWHIKKRNEALKAEYQQARELARDSAPTPEEIAEAKASDDEEIVVDLDALQDPFDLKAGIAPAARWDGSDPEIEAEAVRRMDEAHRERSDRIERLRDRGTIRNGPPWHRVRRGAGFVDIPPTDYEFEQWRKARGCREWEEPPYALPGESFEHAAKRHLGIQKSSELLEMQRATREEMGPSPEEIPNPFKVRDEPRDARAEQPQPWDSEGEERSRLVRVARSVGIKTKKNRSQSTQARAQKRDEHGRFAS